MLLFKLVQAQCCSRNDMRDVVMNSLSFSRSPTRARIHTHRGLGPLGQKNGPGESQVHETSHGQYSPPSPTMSLYEHINIISGKRVSET